MLCILMTNDTGSFFFVLNQILFIDSFTHFLVWSHPLSSNLTPVHYLHKVSNVAPHFPASLPKMNATTNRYLRIYICPLWESPGTYSFVFWLLRLQVRLLWLPHLHMLILSSDSLCFEPLVIPVFSILSWLPSLSVYPCTFCSIQCAALYSWGT
jgi:hypothetical protein